MVWDPLLHTPYISSPNRHLFAAHAHIIAACSAVIPTLCHLYLISLSAPYFEICLLAKRHTSTVLCEVALQRAEMRMVTWMCGRMS